MNKNNDNIERKIKRRHQVESGVFDGRYRTKVVPDKKKERERRKCREKIVP